MGTRGQGPDTRWGGEGGGARRKSARWVSHVAVAAEAAAVRCTGASAHRDATVFDHLEDDTGGLARIGLANHALRHRTRLERVVKTQAADV